jgi:predicted RNase H-like HicB family nuclease
MTFTVTPDRDEDGVWVVECPAIPGCASQGKTKEEAIESLKDAIKLCLEVRAERGMPLTIEVDDEEFEGEVALVRQNQELMEFLDQRSRPSTAHTIDEARKLLGIDRPE